MKPQFKFTIADDGTSLAYQVRGRLEDPNHALIFTNGFANTTLFWEPMIERFADVAKLITWDLRGHGRSGPARTSAGIDVCATDLRRVMDAAEVESATLLGFSLGSQIVLEAWRHFPERIHSMVSVLGPYQRPFDTAIDPRVGRALYKVFRRMGPAGARLVLRSGKVGTRLPGSHKIAQTLGFVGPAVTYEHMRPFYDHLGEICPTTFSLMGTAAQEHSAEDLLEAINVPVLIISGGRDSFSPGYVGYRMAERIPHARHVHLELATHTGLLGHTDEIATALAQFMVECSPAWAITTR